MKSVKRYTKSDLGGLKCSAECLDVYDGDTITVLIDFADIARWMCKMHHNTEVAVPTMPWIVKCRMAGYNSAEIKTNDATEKAAAVAARDHLRGLICGRTITCHFLGAGEGALVKKAGNDPYGRELVDVYVDDTYINKAMLDSGHGAAYNGRGEKRYK